MTRTITVKTNPDNALVYIDDKLAGESPVTIPLRIMAQKIMIEKDEDGSLLMKEQLYLKNKGPVYEVFPLDFSPKCYGQAS